MTFTLLSIFLVLALAALLLGTSMDRDRSLSEALRAEATLEATEAVLDDVREKRDRLADEVERWRDLFGPFPHVYRNGAGNGIGHDHNLKTLAVDLDGVIFQYQSGNPWGGCNTYGEVVPGAVEALAGLRDAGWHIAIYSSRNNILQGQAVGNDGRNALELTALIQNQLEKNAIPYDYISLFKPLAAHYIDDRAIRFHDWTQAVGSLRYLEAEKTGAAQQELEELRTLLAKIRDGEPV